MHMVTSVQLSVEKDMSHVLETPLARHGVVYL
jgi:hypothetical protein